MIKEGDQVRHKDGTINGGLTMSVLEVESGKAKCPHIDPKTKDFVDDWFDLDELILVHEGDGGFIDLNDRVSTYRMEHLHFF